jgi:hypothetical protein
MEAIVGHTDGQILVVYFFSKEWQKRQKFDSAVFKKICNAFYVSFLLVKVVSKKILRKF